MHLVFMSFVDLYSGKMTSHLRVDLYIFVRPSFWAGITDSMHGSHSVRAGGVHGAYYGVDQSSYRIQSKASEASRLKTRTSGEFQASPMEDRVIS